MAVVISSSLTLSEAIDGVDLTHARIGYEKLTGTASASTAAAGFSASAANNALTYTYWTPQSLPATWEIDYSEPKTLDYLGIGSHSLGSNNCTITVQAWSGSAWVDIASTTAIDNNAIMFIFEQITVSKMRIAISGTGAPKVGVVYTGVALVMERAIYGGHSPVTLSRQTTFKTNASESGQWLGRSIKSQGLATSYSWQNLTAAWYREYFDPFAISAITQPFFIAWRPETFPNEVAYCFTNTKIKPTNSGARDYLSVSFDAQGAI